MCYKPTHHTNQSWVRGGCLGGCPQPLDLPSDPNRNAKAADRAGTGKPGIYISLQRGVPGEPCDSFTPSNTQQDFALRVFPSRVVSGELL